jgi:hypothetical protein
MELKTTIVVKLQIQGVHCWHEQPLYAKKKFLGYPHRHLFHITCEKLVTDLDREIEFLEFKDSIEMYLFKKYVSGSRYGSWCGDFDGKSCEQIAHELLTAFHLESCSVFEDGENGSVCRKRN